MYDRVSVDRISKIAVARGNRLRAYQRMYTSIEIHNFRGMESLRAEGLRRINLIVGRNNSGKTTFLEAMKLLGEPTNPGFAATIGMIRGQRIAGTETDAMWRPMFHDMNPKTPIELIGRCDDENQERKLVINCIRSIILNTKSQKDDSSPNQPALPSPDVAIGGLQLKYINFDGKTYQTQVISDTEAGGLKVQTEEIDSFIPTGLISARTYTSEIVMSQRYSEIIRRKGKEKVLSIINIIDANIKNVEVLASASGTSIYIDRGSDFLIPLSVCGEGTVRLFSIVVESMLLHDGVLLIDEIDNGLHYSVMKEFWKKLDELAEQLNVQIVATTHNEEMMRLALSVFADKPGTLGLFRIDRKADRHVFTAYDDEAMQAVAELDFEVRG